MEKTKEYFEVGKLYEANRPKFQDWGTLKDMCIATAIQYASQQTTDLQERVKELEGEWVSVKPDFKDECIFITATKYTRNDEDLVWDYSIWQIKLLPGENETGEDCYYLGLLNGDGEEWGPLEDLHADRYLIILPPPPGN